jgi:hypothetical protein
VHFKTIEHPFGLIQRLNPSLIEVTTLDEHGQPLKLPYRWGWRNVLGNDIGTITLFANPATRFIVTLLLKPAVASYQFYEQTTKTRIN